MGMFIGVTEFAHIHPNHLPIQIIEPSLQQTYPNATRWFLTLIHQEQFQPVIGADYKLCVKTAQFDGKFDL
jgi:hypothetical protein